MSKPKYPRGGQVRHPSAKTVPPVSQHPKPSQPPQGPSHA